MQTAYSRTWHWVNDHNTLARTALKNEKRKITFHLQFSRQSFTLTILEVNGGNYELSDSTCMKVFFKCFTLITTENTPDLGVTSKHVTVRTVQTYFAVWIRNLLNSLSHLAKHPANPRNRWQASCLKPARQQFENLSVDALVVGLQPCRCSMPQQLCASAAPQRVKQTTSRV